MFKHENFLWGQIGWLGKATCNVGSVLAELADHVQNDVDEANIVTGSSFKMKFLEGDRFRPDHDDRFGVQRLKKRGEVYLDKVQTETDTFVRFSANYKDQRIEIFEWDDEENQTISKFEVNVAWSEATQRCLLIVDGTEITIPKICERALTKIVLEN